MVIVGLFITLLGFAISFASLGLTDAVSGRLIMTLIGIAVSLVGIIGVLNAAYVKNAIWKKEGRRS
jgi:predicted nucleic acid-binding protein